MKTKGWQKVFKFTFIQFVKTKSFIVSTILITLLFALIAAGINILPKLIGGEDAIENVFGFSQEFNIKTVHILDETTIPTKTDFNVLSESGVTVDYTTKSFDEMIEQIKTSLSAEVFLHLSDVKDAEGVVTGYSATAYRPESEEVIGSSDCDMLLSAVSNIFYTQKLNNLGISSENLNLAVTEVSTSSMIAGAEPTNSFTQIINSILPMICSIVLFMLIFVYGQMVAQSIATEKTSRVMELLLTSIRPLAVVIGKVLAMGLIAILQFILMIVVSSASFFLTAPFGIAGDLFKMIDNMSTLSGADMQLATAFNDAFSSINPLNIFLIFIVFILGFLFFALIAALVGASVSRMEDLAQAMQPMALLGVFGFYLSYFPAIFDIESEGGANALVIFSRYFPISSPFALPSAILTGQMSVVESLISVAVLGACVMVFAIFISKVYESVILHNGNRLKLSDMFKMAKKG